MARRSALVVPLALALVAASGCAEDTAHSGPSGPVIDEADVLPPQDERELNAKLREYLDEERTAIIVNTIQTLDGKTIEQVANDRFNTWGIGHAETQRGVLLLLAIEDRKLRIEIGCGVEPELTNLEAAHIINEMTPVLREGEMVEAINLGVDQIAAELGDLEDEQGPATPRCAELAA